MEAGQQPGPITRYLNLPEHWPPRVRRDGLFHDPTIYSLLRRRRRIRPSCADT